MSATSRADERAWETPQAAAKRRAGISSGAARKTAPIAARKTTRSLWQPTWEGYASGIAAVTKTHRPPERHIDSAHAHSPMTDSTAAVPGKHTERPPRVRKNLHGSRRRARSWLPEKLAGTLGSGAGSPPAGAERDARSRQAYMAGQSRRVCKQVERRPRRGAVEVIVPACQHDLDLISELRRLCFELT